MASRRRARSPSRSRSRSPEVRSSRRSRGDHAAAAGAGGAAAAAAHGSPPPAAAAAASAPPGTAALQALLRFFTVHGRATKEQVERVFTEIKRHCSHPDSTTLPLGVALASINEQIRFMELEVKKHRSEIDDAEWWCLVDNSERVAAANAAIAASEAAAAAALAAADGGDGGAPAAGAASSAADGKKTLDASAVTKLLNPSLFSERELPFFKSVLDGILESSTGHLSYADALHRRLQISAADGSSALSGAALRKMQLSDGEAAHALQRLQEHGWLRELPAGLARIAAGASAKKLRNLASSAPRLVVLGERSYAELKGYIERKTEGRQCSGCRQACVLGVTCVQQSRESGSAGSCGARMHFSCARNRFVVAPGLPGRPPAAAAATVCPEPDCARVWDVYAQNAGGDGAAAAGAAGYEDDSMDERKSEDESREE